MKLIHALVILLLHWALSVSGQGIISDQPKLLFSNERTFGAFLNSNGIGADYQFARYIDARNDRIYQISFDYLKHPKEYKSIVNYEYFTRRFVYGKQNIVWEVKGHFGNQHELYRKYDFSSISIRWFYTGGISLAFQKPIYYDIVAYNSIGQPTKVDEQKFDPAIHPYNYGGNSGFFKGIDELIVTPGITIKTGFCFEYSEREPLVHALEAGISFTAYPKEIEIMATDEINYFFFKIYAGYRFGTLLNISESAMAKSRKARRLERKAASLPAPPEAE